MSINEEIKEEVKCSVKHCLINTKQTVQINKYMTDLALFAL